MKRRQPLRSKRLRAGFTLIELLVALMLFGLVLSTVYGIWSAALRAAKAAETVSEEAQRARIASQALETALACAVLYEQNAGLYAFLADTSGEFATLSLVARLPQSFPGSGLFHGLSLRRVTFKVRKGKDGQNELVLTQRPVMAPIPTGKEKDLASEEIVLIRGVRTFQMEFSDGRTTQWLSEWINPVTKEAWTNELPRAVRFLLSFREPGQSSDFWILRTVYIPSRTFRRAYQGFFSRPVPPGQTTSRVERPILRP